MKRLFKNSYIYILLLVFVCLLSMQVAFASSSVPFQYNIIPMEKINSIIDTKAQDKLSFKLYEEIDVIYYNDNPVTIVDNSFSIDVTGLSGKSTLTFKDKDGQNVSFSYYFSDNSGKVGDYELVANKNLTAYVSTINGIKVIYSDKEVKTIKRLTSLLKKLPNTMLENVNSITLIPYENTSNIAGSAKGNNITLYKFSKYATSTQKNILYHEIAHIWANDLIDNKVIDYSYSDYSKAVIEDNNYVSNYSKSYIIEKNKYSEDFADSVAFFFISERSFKNKYPHRFGYISELLEDEE